MRMILLLALFAGIVPATVANAEGYQLLRFRATWCPPCQTQKGIFATGKIANALKQHNVKDVYIDVDKNPNATKAWKVKSIPCTILVKVNDQNKATAVIRRWNPVAGKAIMGAATYRTFVDPSKELRVPDGQISNNVTKRAAQVAAFRQRQAQFYQQPRRRFVVQQRC